MAVSVGSVLVLLFCIVLTVDHVWSQAAKAATAVTVSQGQTPATGEIENEWEGGGYGGTTDMMTTATATATAAGGEVEAPEMEELITTTTAKPKPTKPKPRKRPKSRRRRPKNLKPKPKKATKAPKPKPTTRAPTQAPTQAPTAAPTPAPTPAPTQAPVKKTYAAVSKTGGAQGQGYVALGGGGGGGAAVGAPQIVHQPVYKQPATTTTPAPSTKSPSQYLYEPHSCPKMDVATWENEVVIYDNKNCAIIVRMNQRLRRPTVTMQAPYW